MEPRLLYITKLANLDSKTLAEVIDDSMIKISLTYAKEYSANPKNFITCFIKFDSIKTVCAFVVQSYKHIGAFAECLTLGKDFTDYANRQMIEDKWKRVLAEILLILYSIIKPN